MWFILVIRSFSEMFVVILMSLVMALGSFLLSRRSFFSFSQISFFVIIRNTPSLSLVSLAT